MSHKLKLCSGAEAVVKFQKSGWQIIRQHGSHTMLVKEGYLYTLSVPMHKELGVGLLQKLLKQAKITAEEFNNI